MRTARIFYSGHFSLPDAPGTALGASGIPLLVSSLYDPSHVLSAVPGTACSGGRVGAQIWLPSRLAVLRAGRVTWPLGVALFIWQM